MNLTFSKERRQKMLEAGHRHKFGSCCVFVPIDEECGIKLYHSKKLRDATIKGQIVAYQHRIGPKVGVKVTLTTKQTEQILRHINEWPWRWRKTPKKLYGYVTERVTQYRPEGYTKKYYRLVDRLHRAGFNTYDISPVNCGKNKSGQLVCLDFDAAFTWNRKLKNKHGR